LKLYSAAVLQVRDQVPGRGGTQGRCMVRSEGGSVNSRDGLLFGYRTVALPCGRGRDSRQ